MAEFDNSTTHIRHDVLKVGVSLFAVFLPEILLLLSGVFPPVAILVNWLMRDLSGANLFFLIYGLLLFGIPAIGFIVLVYKSSKVKKTWVKIISWLILATLFIYIGSRSLLLLMAIQR